MLIKKSEERNDEIPALVYASAAYNTKEDHTWNEYDGWEANQNNQSDDDLHEQNDVDQNGDHSSGSGNGLEVPLMSQAEITDDTPINNEDQPRNQQNNEQLNEENAQRNGHRRRKHHKKNNDNNDEEDGEKVRDGVRLGLGDFCFYGILITRAARLGWDLTILCIFAVILGLSLTLIILAWLQRPLPALPFSLVLGILFFCIGALTFRKFDLTLRNQMLGF